MNKQSAMPNEPFPGAYSQRCVQCESAAQIMTARHIETGKWSWMVQCLNANCRYQRELEDIDLPSIDETGWTG